MKLVTLVTVQKFIMKVVTMAVVNMKVVTIASVKVTVIFSDIDRFKSILMLLYSLYSLMCSLTQELLRFLDYAFRVVRVTEVTLTI